MSWASMRNSVHSINAAFADEWLLCVVLFGIWFAPRRIIDHWSSILSKYILSTWNPILHNSWHINASTLTTFQSVGLEFRGHADMSGTNSTQQPWPWLLRFVDPVVWLEPTCVNLYTRPAPLIRFHWYVTFSPWLHSGTFGSQAIALQ